VNVKGRENVKILNQNQQTITQNYEDVTYAEIDGRVDPNEQLYCFCNYISYGNMIKCDNPLVIFISNLFTI